MSKSDVKKAIKVSEKARKCAAVLPKKRAFRVGKLETVANIAQFERRLLKSATRAATGVPGGVSVKDAYMLSAVCSQLVKTVEVSEIEFRLTALEQRLTGKERL